MQNFALLLSPETRYVFFVSFIAAALAKSKGQDVKAPLPDASVNDVPALRSGLPPNPFASPATETAPAAPAPAPARPWKKRLGYLAAALVVAAAGVSGWMLRPRQTPSALRPQSTAASAGAPAVAAGTPAVPATAGSEPPSELVERVRQLALGAVVTGENPRVIIAGKRYAPGDEVAQGLVLQEVLPGLLVFRDHDGHVCTRRF